MTYCEIKSRQWSKLDVDKFFELLDVGLFKHNFYEIYDVDELLEIYHCTLLNILNEHVPYVRKTVKKRNCPYYNGDLSKMKQTRRLLERRSNRSEGDKQAYKDYCRMYSSALNLARKKYYEEKLTTTCLKTKYQICASLFLGEKEGSEVLPDNMESDLVLAESFNQYFIEKIDKIRQNIPPRPKPNYVGNCGITEFGSFKQLSVDEVKQHIMTMSNKHCSLDLIPTWFIKKYCNKFAHILTKIINTSLITGCFPVKLKLSIVRPTHKKPNLERNDFKSYRPVSNLAFNGKLIERAVHNQIVKYLEESNIMEANQSAYRKNHSVETVLLKIVNDVYIGKENKQSCMLCMLDLSAAFDTLDFDILFDILKYKVGLSSIALAWIKSYIIDREQKVSVKNTMSTCKKTRYGIPQGSILGPLIFTVYLIPMYDIFRRRNFLYHSYADDTQFYVTCKDASMAKPDIEQLANEIMEWLNVHKLKVNPEKTEVIIFHCDDTSEVTINVNAQVVRPVNIVRNLGILLDTKLTFKDQISNVCRAGYYKLRCIGRNRNFLSQSLCTSIVLTLVVSKINFCCTLYKGLPKSQLCRLQKLQNACVRLIFRLRKYTHVTSYYTKLGWLKVEQFIKYRYVVILFNCLQSGQPFYLKDVIENYNPNRNLRSSNQNLLKLPLCRTETGRKSFTYQAPSLWNSLPNTLRSINTVASFKRSLKKHILAEL